MVLIGATFFLVSTHVPDALGISVRSNAFAESPIGSYFVGLPRHRIAATVWLILDSLEYLKSETDSRASFRASRASCSTT